MANDPIETLTVQLEADYSKLVQQTKEGVNQSERELDKLSDAPMKAQGSWQQLGGYLKGQFLGIITGIGAAVVAAFSVSAVTQFFGAMAKGAVDANKQFETFRVQFETLLGSGQAAQQRIEELAQFGIATPFELDQVVEADRLLQTFGGTALATGENLRRVGDSAAAVNADFKEVSFWTGRMYSAMMGGQPFGESAARLQELGILSGDVRQKLEEMQKSGAEGAELWEFYASVVDDKFGGAMDKLSKTLQGVMSNLADFQAMLLREGGEELFEEVRESTLEFYDIISDESAQEALTALAKAFGSIAAALFDLGASPFLESLKNTDADQVNELAKSVQDIGEAIGGLNLNATSFDGLIEALDGLAQGIATATAILGVLQRAVQSTNPALDKMRDLGIDLTSIFTEMLGPITSLMSAFQDLRNISVVNDAFEAITGSSVSEYIGGIEEPAMAAASSLDAMGFAAEGIPDNLRGAGQAAEEAAEDFSKAREKFEDLSRGFLDAQADINEKRADLEEQHGERIADISEDYGERVAGIQEDYGERVAEIEEEIAEKRQEIAEDTAAALVDLAEDTAERRAQAEANAAEQLASLESDTQSSISDIQEEAREDERKAVEEHQREMKRLHDQYVDSLEDAVNNRDARAIVNLRRRYQQEKKEREEGLQTGQQDRRATVDREIEQAREAEREKREEIQRTLAEELQSIAEAEAKKREEIALSHQEQLMAAEEAAEEKRAQLEEKTAEELADAAEKHAEMLAQENENYAERQQALNEMLQKKLEDVAKQLADEKDITEEGAQAILESLNDYYGVGGEIDSLMEDYYERRRAQAEAADEFDRNISGAPDRGGGQLASGGSGGDNAPILLPAFQEGGVIPGPKGKKRVVLAHAGELVVPYDQIARQFDRQKGSMEASAGGRSEMDVNLQISGSAPPGLGNAEIDKLAGVMVSALKDAGINARQR